MFTNTNRSPQIKNKFTIKKSQIQDKFVNSKKFVS